LQAIYKETYNQKRKSKKIINICEISYLAFYINLKYSENTLFLLSLYKLDQELEDRQRGQEPKSKAKLNLIN
jgi:hypothetical protein